MAGTPPHPARPAAFPRGPTTAAGARRRLRRPRPDALAGRPGWRDDRLDLRAQPRRTGVDGTRHHRTRRRHRARTEPSRHPGKGSHGMTKDIKIALGVDVDAVVGWLGS